MHTHAHPHAHSHGHAHGAGASERRIGWAAILTGGFMVAEFAGGIISGSLALIADAGHMLTDTAGLTLAWLGFRLARRPADWKRSYGYDRFGVLVAFANGLILFAIAGWIVVEAVHRFRVPSPVLGGVMLWVALAGLAINLVAFWLLSGNHDNLNMRAAALHVVGDLLGSVAAIAAAVVILATGWTPIDPILSVFVSLLILGSAARIVRDAGHILLQGTPIGLDPKEIAASIAESVPAVHDVHHVHAWSLSQERPIVTLHARVSDNGEAPERITAAIKAHLRERYGVGHATVELEFEHCADTGNARHGPAPRNRR
ncbi:cation diffusion facilitator family transporter [Hyphomicrobium sp. CS1GBMeth3]|uniref:cation diffusion facilitator family transporter n=1 Tax=Hyphomicrobium sp. CS1GBMeth3 TaxID=1892845 RepID=UPI00093134BA|nr:cation diffusion facilitator family transporter [Hyphomicrobium sp. CS1GBMeth3]